MIKINESALYRGNQGKTYPQLANQNALETLFLKTCT